ncbi:hypothetical protein KVR01_012281 [Diaporthe batatas]|uniref:uncharacterized protein n=1 Tax=Diaporthe batatas TaxID=748121 RepID=UPI001D04BCA7|nr:uncharacterized protein KVR01_012281 [Diaporthe batatas]KAG8158009.1 hypothetical protein KVR01_012281 [Diaporthe batatas]
MSLLRRVSKFSDLCLPMLICHPITSSNALVYPQSSTIFSGNYSAQVDLGYAIYEGITNASTGLNTFKGIRYAAPPTGPLRWQPPQLPALNRTSVQPALSYGPICPQSFNAVPGNEFILGDEDCLNLNVYAPANADKLPVLVWIHGGGYGFFNGQQDMSSIITTNNNTFIGVGIQYRAIAASPYLPTQYRYNDFLPTQAYYAFAGASGCPADFAYGNTTKTIFECLQSQDSLTLQQASYRISASGTFGSWGFLPVTDGYFIRERPSEALLKRRINGQLLLTSNTAEEGPAYTPQTVTSEEELMAWLLHTFPLLGIEDANRILYYYPFVPPSDNTTLTYPTAGDSGASAITTSQIAHGHQQRANLILGETTFMCPSYWLATAFSSPSTGHRSYKYQYSIPTALHGYDLEADFGPPRRNQGTDFVRALQLSWGNFVRFGDPSTPSSVADGTDSAGPEPHPLEHWPEFSAARPLMVDFNQTGGTPYEFTAVQVRNGGAGPERRAAYGCWRRGQECDFAFGAGTDQRLSRRGRVWLGRGTRGEMRFLEEFWADCSRVIVDSRNVSTCYMLLARSLSKLAREPLCWI